MEQHTNRTPLQCDLHTHSVFSDGTYTPTEIVAAAKELGLIVALTDHNTTAGLPEFTAAAAALGVTAVPGVEFSTEHGGKELHLLGLFVLPEHYAPIERLLRQSLKRKESCIRELVARLNSAGYALDYHRIQSRSPGGTVNRAHVAAQLLEQGYVDSVGQAFATLLGEESGFYVRPPQPQLTEVIQALRQLGILPVLAHPLQELTEQELLQILPEAKAAGLVAMETAQSAYSPEDTRLTETLCRQFGLLPGGGSDFHGAVRPEVTLGAGKGNLRIPAEVYTKLLAARKAL